jgi:hypothetical protein
MICLPITGVVILTMVTFYLMFGKGTLFSGKTKELLDKIELNARDEA